MLSKPVERTPEIEESTEALFFAEYDRTKADLAQCRTENELLKQQLRDNISEQEKLAYKVDFLTQDIRRLTEQRDQYQKIAIRVAGKMDGAIDGMCAMLHKMQEEIQEAAYTAPETPPARPPEQKNKVLTETKTILPPPTL